MRLLATFGLILICCHALAIETDGYLPITYQGQDFYMSLIKFLEKLKEKLQTGDEELGLQPIDPLLIKEFFVNLDKEKVKIVANLTNIDVRSLSAYNVNEGDLELAGLKIRVNLTWSVVCGKLNYSINGNFERFPVYGVGNISLLAKGFDFDINMSFKTKNTSYLEISTIDTNFSLKELVFQISGFYYDEEISKLISAIVSDTVPKMMIDYQDKIKDKIVHPTIREIGNEFLSDKTISDLIKMITGG